MSFLDELEVISEETLDFVEDSLFPRRNLGTRHCEWIGINDKLCLSIQASAMHYCIPRELVPLDEYTHFELAIIYNAELSNRKSIFKEFNRYEELIECWESGVFACVEKELLEDLYKYCKEKLK